MQHSDITARREGKTVIVSKTVSLSVADILAMELRVGETVTIDLTVALDVDELSQLIDADPGKPGIGNRLTETAFTEVIKGAVKIGIAFGKRWPQRL